MTDDEFRELIEMSHAINELTRQPGWTYLIDRAVHSISAKQRNVLGGSVSSLEDYKKNIGWLEGANFVITIPERVDGEIRAARAERAERDADAA